MQRASRGDWSRDACTAEGQSPTSKEKEGKLFKLDVQTTQSSFTNLTEHQQLVKFQIRNSLDHPINLKEKDIKMLKPGVPQYKDQLALSTVNSIVYKTQPHTESFQTVLQFIWMCALYIYIYQYHLYLYIYLYNQKVEKRT